MDDKRMSTTADANTSAGSAESADPIDAALTLVRALADLDRLRIAAALIERDHSPEELASALQLRASDVVRHLTRLSEANLVVTDREGQTRRYRFERASLYRLRREALAGDKTAPVLEGGDVWERKVLHDFLAGERLKEIPAQRKKRLVVLRWLSGRFEPATRYPEAQVNTILQRHHPDFAALRRALVDERLMRRDHGIYWREAEASNSRADSASGA